MITNSLYAQESGGIAQVKRDTTVNLKRLEDELFQVHLQKLKNEMLNKSHLFYTLESFTGELFIKEYEGKELNAYAFNPPWEKLKNTLNILETEFNIWNTAYSQSKILTHTNFLEIRKNFDVVVTKLKDQSLSNCNSKENCNKIKKKIIESRESIKNLVTELTKFILI
jgi:hypothetical protein